MGQRAHVVPGAIELDSKRERPFGRSARDACHAGAGSLVDSGTLPTLDASRPRRHEASRDGSVCDCGSGPRSDLGAGWLEKLQEKSVHQRPVLPAGVSGGGQRRKSFVYVFIFVRRSSSCVARLCTTSYFLTGWSGTLGMRKNRLRPRGVSNGR